MSIHKHLHFCIKKYRRAFESFALMLVQAAVIVSLLPQSAHAHAIAGDRVFPATLEVDDPSVATELSLPAVSWARGPLDDNGNFPNLTNIGAEFDLLIAPNLAVGISDGCQGGTRRLWL